MLKTKPSQGAEGSSSPSPGPALNTRPLVIKRVPIAQVLPWDDNPRGIRIEDFDRLKRQILELGVYKPLLAVREKGKYVVLGGNMRIRALKELGAREVEVSIVEAKTKAEKIKYALSDNDRAGFYEEEKLAELVLPHLKDINLGDFKIDLGNPIDLKKLAENFGPNLDDKPEENYQAQYGVLVVCEGETEQKSVYDRLLELGFTNLKVLAV